MFRSAVSDYIDRILDGRGAASARYHATKTRSGSARMKDQEPFHDTRALQAYLGHRNIQHTVRYTELSPGRFKDFWR